MHIADVRTIPLSYRCETPYMSAAGVQTARNALLVEVETDNGLVGIGEAGSAGGPLASTQVVVEHELKPLLLGEDPLRLEYLWQKMFQRTRQHGRRGIVMHAISGIDVALWDIAWAGGFTECRRIAAFAHVYNIMAAPHAFSSALTLVASMHLLASLPNGLMLEFDQNPNALRQHLFKEPISAEAGYVKLPERPGLGVELDPMTVERYRVQ